MIKARELHQALNSKRQFANWIRQRLVRYNFVHNFDYITFNNFVKRVDSNLENRSTEYYVTIDMAKELGFKIGYRHYYEDENIVIIKDISNQEYQIYYKPAGLEKIKE